MTVAIGKRSFLDGHATAESSDKVMMASCSKMLVGCALAKEAERGTITFSAQIGPLIPSLSKFQTHPAFQATLSDLMCHRSGLAASDPFANLNGTAQQWRQSLLLSTFSKPPLDNPGAKYTYGPGPTYVAAVLEQITSVPYEEILRRQILVPAGLESIGFGKPWELFKNQPISHRKVQIKLQHADRNWNQFLKYDPSGGGHSTIADFCKMGFLVLPARMHGLTVLNEASKEMLLKSPYNDGICIGSWAQAFDRTGKWYWLNGSSGVGDTSQLFIEQAKGISVALATNIHNDDGGTVLLAKVWARIKQEILGL